MASRSSTGVLYQRVMEETGFYRNGVPTSGVIEAESLRNDNQQLEKRIKYSAVIDPEQINATAVFELSGSPCIYFTQLDQSDPDPRELARLHKLSWNHGLAPMLWVVTPTNVRLYNCYSEPTENNPESNLIALFENTEASLKQLNEHASRLQLESGEFWQWQNAKQIDRKKRVDRVLVEDLQKSEKKLRAQGLESQVAHALLMRSIFIAYLQDRGILNTQFFRSLFNVDSFTDLLNDVSATRRLFEWLQITFNGDMFSTSSSDSLNAYETRHLEIVKDLVGGTTEIETGQERLWRFYDFKVIPVELISSIYENFLYSKDSQAAKELSVHYTPINLVDLVLDEVFKDLNGSAKVLDLSCGSGVFLVESLRRLVVKRWMNGEERSRQLVRDTLYNQIYGVDVEPQAVQIAAFSLYLTALELDYELEHNAPISGDLKFRELIGRNLFSSNTFDETAVFNNADPFINKRFDAIVGNPPWTKSKANQLATSYCERKRPNEEHPDEGYPKGYPIARSENPDQAFLWRVGDFANENTSIGLILHSKPFFSNTPKAWQAKEALFKRFKPSVIINLSKLRRDRLFPNSEAPALVFIGKGCRSQPKDSFYLVCPERSLDFRQHGIIEIAPENIKRLSVDGAATDPDMLKVASWAGARDMNLIQKVRSFFPSIESVAGHSFHQGFIGGSRSKEVPEELCHKKLLPSGQMPRYQVDEEALDFFQEQRTHRPMEVKTYKAPLVLISAKLDSEGVFSAFSHEDVIFTEKYSGIAFLSNQKHLAHYINAVINSSVASYFLFLTSSSWGVERDELKPQDFTRLPVPTPSEKNTSLVSKIIAIEHELRTSNIAQHQNLKNRLDEAVFELYGLDQTERVLVEDGVNLTINLRMKREASIALRKPSIDELKLYAFQFLGAIQPFLQTLRERVLVADVVEVNNAPLQVIKFSFVPAPGRKHIVQTTQVQELKAVLNRIAEQLPQQIADRIFTRRDLRIYSGQDIYIVKPAQKRYWSRSAGLNDADLILSEHLRVNCAAIG
ncbi:MAG: N-6 DNA methylase [Phormidesmis sp. CAN_BIN44]|nr:N-6 DNA methylase [Phormidesmis sp. CAN_BIN44]